MSIRVNYDDIAHLYDERVRDHPPDRRLAAFVAGRQAGRTAIRVLDVGCGTGKQLASNRQRFERMTMVGVDRSAGMLRIARTRGAGVSWIQADAEALPLGSATFDYATNQFSYPHIQNKRRFVAEVFRVLRPGGLFVLTNIDPWAMPGWIIYRYFPEARELDEQDYLPPPSLAALLKDVGFAGIETASTDLSRDHDLATFLASASRRHTASQLMAIPDAAYDAGLRRLREDIARGVTVRSDFVVLTVSGTR